MKQIPLLVCLLLASVTATAGKDRPGHALPHPKNIIIMIADGMGYNHVRAANLYLGKEAQPFEQFPVRLAMCTYPARAGSYKADDPSASTLPAGYNPSLAWKDTAFLKHSVTESAAAATALATGVKTYNNALGVGVNGDTLENLCERAKALGKSAGVVTTVEFSHATPAGFVAHNRSRVNYTEIARDMLLRSRCDVIMGCGDPMYDANGKAVAGRWNNTKYVADSAFWLQMVQGSGTRTTFDLKGNQLTVADADGDGHSDPWTVIRTAEDFRSLASGKAPSRMLSCAEVFETLQASRSPLNGETKNSLPYTTPLNTTVPTLAEMSRGALNVLSANRKGFFLMIEGGATDWASHDNHKGRLIEEMTGFFEAVAAVTEWIEAHGGWEKNLLIVTGDHETGLLWGDKPFEPLTGKGKGELPVMTFFSGDHTNSLIPFFAKGAGSVLFNSFADENDGVRGPFIQNAEVAQGVKLLWQK